MKDLGGKKDNIPLVHAVVRAVDPDNGLALQDVDGLLGVRMGVRGVPSLRSMSPRTI